MIEVLLLAATIALVFMSPLSTIGAMYHFSERRWFQAIGCCLAIAATFALVLVVEVTGIGA